MPQQEGWPTVFRTDVKALGVRCQPITLLLQLRYKLECNMAGISGSEYIVIEVRVHVLLQINKNVEENILLW